MDAINTQFKTDEQTAIEHSRGQSRLWTVSFTIFIVLLLFAGFLQREDSYLSPSDGLGYWLGIVGGSLMLLLMLYPLRKTWRAMSGWGPIKYWFQLHMLFGIIGPVLILFHSNFKLGSTNSNLALFCMLIVASSGLIGRYLYSKIHYGLYGHKASLKELRADIKITRGNLGSHISLSPTIIKAIKRHEKFMIKQRNFLVHLLTLPYIYLSSKLMRARIRSNLVRDLKKQARKNNWDRRMLRDFIQEARLYLGDYFTILVKITHLTMYARLFSFWHILHMPLFIMLVLTGIIHVVYVHMY